MTISRRGPLAQIIAQIEAEIAAVSSGGISDGDKGDITVSSSGTVWTVDPALFAAPSHTHTASQVTDFSEAVDDRVSSLLTAGTNVTLTYNDGANTLTIDAAGGGSTWTNVEKDLGTTARSGKFTISGLSGLTIGKPVIIQQAVGPYTGKGTLADEAEMDEVSVSGSVTATDTITAYWKSQTFVKGNHKFNYLIGS